MLSQAMPSRERAIARPPASIHDPDGNGIELYWDRPRYESPVNPDGSYALVVEALDIEGLLAEEREG
jgi:catechol-2,3-dioxygenase